jgi:uncharacterized protein YndB with AHSA1/START domain
MPNDFEPVVGRRFRFHVDPTIVYSGIVECEVLEVRAPERLVYSWTIVPRKGRAPKPAMRLEWTLVAERGGTLLRLRQSGLAGQGSFIRFAMNMGWSRMMKRLLPKVVANVAGGSFTAGAITRRDYGTKTVPPGFAK